MGDGALRLRPWLRPGCKCTEAVDLQLEDEIVGVERFGTAGDPGWGEVFEAKRDLRLSIAIMEAPRYQSPRRALTIAVIVFQLRVVQGMPSSFST